jgi:exopolyphosphatase / guanosine-5'-triphosphate,3'-diphosphate pyrophosphatase
MTSARRVAAIDVGTNTVLLLVAEGSPDAPVAVLERATITRLGAGVDRTGELSAEAIARTTACLADYAAQIAATGADRVEVVCTSAARDARNGATFIEHATRALGVAPRIIEGDEEARLTFDGALTGLSAQGAVTVFDVGGGSTEVIHGTVTPAGARVSTAASVDVGSVRLTERHVKHDPPTPRELDLVRADVRRALATIPQASTTELVGVAGTVTTLAAMDQGLSVYDSARVHGAILSRDVVERLVKRLTSVALEERRRISGLEPARADVIIAGGELVLAVLDWAGAERLRVSDRGVRWGLARTLLR